MSCSASPDRVGRALRRAELRRLCHRGYSRLVDATTGFVDWIPTVAASQPVCIKAVGPCGEESLRFLVAVTARATTVMGLTPPKIVTVPAPAGRCGEPYAYAPMAVGSSPIKWSLGRNTAGVGAPKGMTISDTTGALSWTPEANKKGAMRVTLVATNEAGATDQDLLVEVDCAVSKGSPMHSDTATSSGST